MNSRSNESERSLDPSDTFARRHIGPSEADVGEMLASLGLKSLDQLIDQTVPADLRFTGSLGIGPARSEHETLVELGSARREK